jgi:dipeptidase E
MKLYLSSFRLGNSRERLVELAGGARQVAVIPNALDAVGDPTRTAVIERGVHDLWTLGFESTILDLREYFGDPTSLGNDLARYGILFVTGGNVFILRRAMRQSGLDAYLQSEAGTDLLYAAYSAGACVLGPTLHGFEYVDDPCVVPSGYEEDAIWDGLGLIDFVFIPHYESEHHESAAIMSVVDFAARNDIPFKALRDGDVFIRG